MVYDYLPLDQHSKKPLYQQLYEQIRRAVQEGHLSQGEKMPSIRKLAEDLELSRTTIEAAYQQLCVEGYLKSKPQSGYFVAASSKGRVYLRRIPVDNYRRIQRALVKYNLGTDVVDLQNADLLRWKRCVKDVLNRRDVLVSYGEKQGEQELREALSSYSYSVRGVVSTADSIVIGAGTQQLLSVLCGLHRGTGLSPSGAGVSGLWLSAPPSRRRPGGNQHERIRGFQSQRAVRQPLQSDEGQGCHSHEPQV